MPLGNIIKAGKKMYDAAKDAGEEDFIPSLGKRNSMPTTSTRVSAREAAAPKPAPKSRANPMDMGRAMGGMTGNAIKAINRRKKMVEDL